jgi:hypothetical protein
VYTCTNIILDIRSGCHQRSAIFVCFIFEECAKFWPVKAAGMVRQGFSHISQARLLVVHSAKNEERATPLQKQQYQQGSEEELITVGIARPNGKQIFL